MAKHPVVLIDDPIANARYDLRRTLRGWRVGVAAVITPLLETGAPTDSTAPQTSGTAPEAFVGKNDSESTRALKNAPIRYRVVEGKRIAAREFSSAEAADVLLPIAADAPILVSFVSYATTPLIVALAHAEAFRDLLRVGITDVRLDTNYNLARKLIVDGLIHYHEHTRVLEKVLCNRLALMQQEHQNRRRAGSA